MEQEGIVGIVGKMTSITLEEMKSVHLMDRVDSKFVIPVMLLPKLLEEMVPYFKVQTKNGTTIAPYTTQYFDTSGLDMFLMHQNGKQSRQKIRIRSYVDSKLSFLEIKKKNNKGRTSKIRIPVESPFVNSVEELNAGKDFLDANSSFQSQSLVPVLNNDFYRITFVNNRKTERITIDINLSFRNLLTGDEKRFDNIVILELKQDGWQHSDFRDILMKLRVRKNSFSKYCMGTVSTNSNVKYNRFKSSLAKINKLS
jgi:VTC domain.